MQQHIRLRVDQVANAHQFGSPIEVYQQVLSPSTKRSTYGIIAMYIFLTMFFPCYALIGSLLSTPRSSRIVIIISVAFFVSFGLFTLIFALVLFRRVAISWYVLHYSEGFISVKGRRIDTVHWDQVTGIRQEHLRKNGVPRAIYVHQDILFLVDGTQLTFSDTFLNLKTAHLLDPRDRDLPWFRRPEAEVASIYERFEAAREQVMELIHVMEHEVMIRLFPRIVATYQEGLSVSFGKLQVSIEGISSGKASLPWDEFGRITLWEKEEGSLPESVPYTDSRSLAERLIWWQHQVLAQDIMLITRKDERVVFWSMVVSKVPNAFLLMELADYALRQQAH